MKQVEELGVEGRHERRKGRRAPMKGINSLRVSGEGRNQVAACTLHGLEEPRGRANIQHLLQLNH